MARAPELRTTQSIFWRLITAPEGAAHGIAALEGEGALESDDVSFLVRGDDRLGATERVDIYADMYFYRLRDCLAEDYPKLCAVLGDAHFHNLVTDYLWVHPPSNFSLRELGRSLPRFLSTHPQPRWADLAALEWARVDVFDAIDDTPVARADLLEGRVESVAAIRALQTLRMDSAMLRLWKEVDVEVDGTEIASPRVGDALDVCVWRKGDGVRHRSMREDEAACLEALTVGATSLAHLGELVDAHQPPERGSDAAGARLAELLDSWLAGEMLRSA